MFTIQRSEDLVNINVNGPIDKNEVSFIKEQLDEIIGWMDPDRLDISAGIHKRGLSRDEHGYIVEKLIPEISRKGVSRISFID